MNPLVSLCKRQTDRLTDRQTNTHSQTKYRNPRCACQPRVNYKPGGSRYWHFLRGVLTFSSILLDWSGGGGGGGYSTEIKSLTWFLDCICRLTVCFSLTQDSSWCWSSTFSCNTHLLVANLYPLVTIIMGDSKSLTWFVDCTTICFSLSLDCSSSSCKNREHEC